ncbi:MAG: hypothetical protein ACRDTH_05045 [Pseudonocardiaceae bacterium]
MPISPGAPPPPAGQEATLSTRPTLPATNTKDRQNAAAPGYGPVLAAARPTLAV